MILTKAFADQIVRCSKFIQFPVEYLVAFSLAFFIASLAAAGTPLQPTFDRDAALRAGHVWQQPGWIQGDSSSEFKFDSTWKFASGPALEAGEQVLKSPFISCKITPKALKKQSEGWTAKFFCELPELIQKPVLKVKYRFSDGEIAGELLGTRLLWALGFGADRMYFYNQVRCYGCSEDPHRDRRIDSQTLQSPRIFEDVAIERKVTGTEIGEGFGFSELLDKIPKSGPARLREQTQREALRLLAVFMRHSDNKPANHAAVCSGEVTAKGGCDGTVLLYLHDVGLTFGSGFYENENSEDWKASKAIFEHWDKAQIWKDPSECQGEIGLSPDEDMSAPIIREEGRQFLVKLLRAFSAGAEGRRRVESLFDVAHADRRYGTIQNWADTFYRKVDEIEFPLGASQPNFKCPAQFEQN